MKGKSRADVADLGMEEGTEGFPLEIKIYRIATVIRLFFPFSPSNIALELIMRICGGYIFLREIRIRIKNINEMQCN